MRFVDASSLIDPSVEILPFRRLALPYIAAASPGRLLLSVFSLTFNPITVVGTPEVAAPAAALTISPVHPLQRESDNHSVNTECGLLFDMAEGMMMSPPTLGIGAAALEAENRGLGGTVQQSCWGTHPQPQTSDDYSVNSVDEWFHMPTQLMASSPTLMNYSLPSDDSLPLGGSFDPYRFWDDGAYSVGYELHIRERMTKINEFWVNIAVQAREKGLQVAHTDVNVFWKCKYTATSVIVIEVEVGIRGLMIELNSVTHPPRSGQCGVHLSALLEFLEKEFGDTSNSVQPIITHFEVASLELEHQNSLNRLLLDILERLAAELEKSHTVRILPALLEAECRRGGNEMMQLDSPCEGHIPKSSATNEETDVVNRAGTIMGFPMFLHHCLFGKSLHDLKVSPSTFKRARRVFGITRRHLEEVATASEENHTTDIWPALETHYYAAGRGGMLLQQEDSSFETHIPISSATNEERNNVVELNNSVDAKGGNSSSEKTNTISRCEKDYGITRQVLEQLFGKTLDDAAKTLKVSASTLKRACPDFGITRRHLEEVATASEENHTADIWPALETQYNAAGRGGMLLQQEDSSSEAHIPISSATNEERNNVVELSNSIDAKGGNSSSEKTDTISRWEKDYGITRQVLQQLFGKSRDDAAKTLKVSSSTLKRACRDFGISRWPNHKRKRPNCSLNQEQDVQAVNKHKGIQPCPALPPLEVTNTSQCDSLMSVKVTYKNDTIRFPLSYSSTMKYLEEQLEIKLKISLENMSIKYQDDEDDWISLICDSDLMYGMRVLRSYGKTTMRMMVTPKFD